MAILLRGWSDDITVLTDGPADIDGRARLDALGIPVAEARLDALDVEGGELRGVLFEDGETLALGGVLIGVPQHERSGIPEALGCATTELGHVAVDMFGTTSVTGVYAAGDITTTMQSVAGAAGQGAAAGAGANGALAAADARLGASCGIEARMTQPPPSTPSIQAQPSAA